MNWRFENLRYYINVGLVGLTRYLFLSVVWAVTKLIFTFCILVQGIPHKFKNSLYAFIFRK
jgi:hypothetical protein